jgi:Putative MetA-pathway of phenol degradation
MNRRAELYRIGRRSNPAIVLLSIRRSSSLRLIGALALVTVCLEVHAQDLEPRAYANTPVGLNFLIGGYGYSKGTIGTDPSVPLTDTEVKLNSAVVAYVRTLDLWGRSGKVDVIIPYTWADGSAKLAAQERTRKVSGFNDPRLRFSMLLYGGPALSLEDFLNYKPDLIVGTSLDITPPLGQYDSDKLLNIGTNRWSFKPELGISKTLGPLTFELATGIRFYTDNNDFLDGRTLEVNPLYSLQAHLIYSITPGIWLGLDGLYYTGGRGIIDGNKGESLENARVGLTLALPVNRYNSIKLYGTTGVYSKTGSDFDQLGIAWQLRFGGGL